jgi:hypothetical protein
MHFFACKSGASAMPNDTDRKPLAENVFPQIRRFKLTPPNKLD